MYCYSKRDAIYYAKKIHYAYFGKEKCKALALKSIFWIGMSKHIDDFVGNYDIYVKVTKEI